MQTHFLGNSFAKKLSKMFDPICFIVANSIPQKQDLKKIRQKSFFQNFLLFQNQFLENRFESKIIFIKNFVVQNFF